jgi:predicted ArsR family transcriptional regulator
VEPLPDDVRRFLDANVESIEQLEILRVLAESSEAEWDADALARAIQAPPADAAAHLAALHARGLVALRTEGAGARGRHGARSPELAAGVERLLRCYRERPVTMIKVVYARANERLRAFADAFKLRKEP